MREGIQRVIKRLARQQKSLAAVACGAALLLALAAPALAGEVAIAIVTGGELALAAPVAGPFAIRRVTGQPQTTRASLSAFEVGDLTGLGAGWSLTIQSSPITDAGHALPSGSLAASQPGVVAVDSASPLPDVAPGPYVIDDAPVRIASAGRDEGMGHVRFSETTLNLRLPEDVFAGSYQGTATISLIMAP